MYQKLYIEKLKIKKKLCYQSYTFKQLHFVLMVDFSKPDSETYCLEFLFFTFMLHKSILYFEAFLFLNYFQLIPNIQTFLVLNNMTAIALFRPMSQSGRPLSGFVRPSTQGGRPGTMEKAIMTPRTAHTARPVTSASGRYVRLGTVRLLQCVVV